MTTMHAIQMMRTVQPVLFVFISIVIFVIVCVRLYTLRLLKIFFHRDNCERLMRQHTSHLIVCTHDFEHVDLFFAASECERWKRLTGRDTYFVMAPHFHNYVFSYLVSNRKTIYVRGGTVRKILDTLKHSNVCLFIYRGTKHTGFVHVMKEFNGPVILSRLHCADNRKKKAQSYSLDGAQNLSDVRKSVSQSLCNTYVSRYSLYQPSSSNFSHIVMKDLLNMLYPEHSK